MAGHVSQTHQKHQHRFQHVLGAIIVIKVFINFIYCLKNIKNEIVFNPLGYCVRCEYLSTAAAAAHAATSILDASSTVAILLQFTASTTNTAKTSAAAAALFDDELSRSVFHRCAKRLSSTSQYSAIPLPSSNDVVV